MDVRLKRAIAAVARDRQSGAAELALRAASALEEWLSRRCKPTGNELLEIAQMLLRAQPAMAPLLRLANELALGADSDSVRHLRETVGQFRDTVKTAPKQIATQFCQEARSLRSPIVATYSYSSTVLSALSAAKPLLRQVWCSEGRPGLEGLRTARVLAGRGLQVVLMSDAALLEAAVTADFLLVGADAVERGGFRNKIGTGALVERMAAAGKPAWVLADSTKFWPEEAFQSRDALLQSKDGPPEQIWKRRPRSVKVWNPYFAPCAYLPNVRILSELGWLDARQIEARLKKLRISPRLRQLVR